MKVSRERLNKVIRAIGEKFDWEINPKNVKEFMAEEFFLSFSVDLSVMPPMNEVEATLTKGGHSGAFTANMPITSLSKFKEAIIEHKAAIQKAAEDAILEKWGFQILA